MFYKIIMYKINLVEIKKWLAWGFAYCLTWSIPQNLVPIPNRVAWSNIFWFRTGKVFNSKTKFYMYEKKRLYSTRTHALNFISTGACLVPLFDCPNLVLTFDPNSRTLIPGFNVSRLKDLVAQLSQRSTSDELSCQAISKMLYITICL